MDFGTRMRDLRLKRGISQRKLAEAAGVSTATLNNYETGKSGNPRLAELVNVAHTLGTTVGYLIGEDHAGPADLELAAAREEIRILRQQKAELTASRNEQKVRQVHEEAINKENLEKLEAAWAEMEELRIKEKRTRSENEHLKHKLADARTKVLDSAEILRKLLVEG